MADYHFCTIASKSHLPHVRVLLNSVQRQQPSAKLHVLFVDDRLPSELQTGMSTYDNSDLQHDPVAINIWEKYQHEADHLRWALKPVFLRHLLQNHNEIIYLDNDICFFSAYEFLFAELKKQKMLLTPHWSPFYPLPHTKDFELSFQIGLFNAGFIGVNNQAVNLLKWWAEVCLFKIEKNTSAGYFVDQRYLDLLPLLDENIGIVRHQGCNVGGWNIHQSKRFLVDGKVLINKRDPLVFIHFNQSTLDQLSHGNDPLLEPYYKQYRDSFQSLGFNFEELFSGRVTINSNSIKKLKTSLRLRTRLKEFVFKLYQKI